MTVKIDDAAYRRMLVAGLERGLGQQGALLVGHIKKKINRSQPVSYGNSGRAYGKDPSKPGEPPKKVTQELLNSINFVVETDPGAITLSVGTNIPYGRYLELGTSNEDGSPKMAPRPYLRSSLVERFERLVKGVARELRRESGQ